MHQIPESYHSPAAFKDSAILKLTGVFRDRTLGSILSSLKLKAMKMHQWYCIFQSYARSKQFIKNANKPKKQHRLQRAQNKKCVSSRASVLARLSVVVWSVGHPAAITLPDDCKPFPAVLHCCHRQLWLTAGGLTTAFSPRHQGLGHTLGLGQWAEHLGNKERPIPHQCTVLWDRHQTVLWENLPLTLSSATYKD